MAQTATSDRYAYYQTHGFLIAPRVVPEELAERAAAGALDVLSGRYDLGEPALWGLFRPDMVGKKLVKVNDAHRSNKALRELVCHPELGRLAAEATGAERVQVWTSQLIHKPSNVNEAGNIGWHQDMAYWERWQGEVFTAWVALGDVTADSGPMRFVDGSHRWGDIGNANHFTEHDLDRQKREIAQGGMKWEEVSAVLPPGGVSLHHRHTIHGSGPNTSGRIRLSIAIHLCTEKSGLRPDDQGHYYADLHDEVLCPVIYGKDKG